jgi:protein-S-isoprenylcysteine O-methyltransferase Ste14
LTIIDEASLRVTIAVLWIGWLVYWIVAARYVKATRWRESCASQLLYRVPLLLAASLLAVPDFLPLLLTKRFLPPGPGAALLGTIVVALGLGLAIWARWHLGRNWSATITLKEGHSLVRTGPYRYLRHPIYAGLLLGLVGTAAAIGEWRGILAVALALTAFVRKILVEETRMRGSDRQGRKDGGNQPRRLSLSEEALWRAALG